ncbi:MAG: NHLP bacteriocin system secretion protein, partial [Acidobacteriota bacterium]
RTEAFSTQVGVWFEFAAPPSGHVIVDGLADQSIFPLGLQLAVLGTDDGTCTGNFVEFGSHFSDEDLDESVEVSCLKGGQSYWVLIDGFGAGGIGAFTLDIRDAGDITPRYSLVETICAGESLEVANSIYTETGTYADTINIYEGCDSIVFTDLTVLEPISIQVLQTEPAMGLGAENGRAEAVVAGGSGNYQINWCNGEVGTEAVSLVGNTECCIEVTDDLGCTGNICFTVDLVTLIDFSFAGDSLSCFGETDGVIEFSVDQGIAPYNYTWERIGEVMQGSGTIEQSRLQAEQEHRAVLRDLSERRSAIADMELQLRELDLSEAELRERDAESRFELESRLSAARRTVASLEAELQGELIVRSDQAGTVLELVVAEGERIDVGHRLGTLDVGATDERLACLAYFEVKDGKKLRAGMTVQVAPDSVQRERFGSVVGRVGSVSGYPVSTEAAAQAIGNAALAGRITAEGRQIEVHASLEPDASTTSGFRWTSRGGPEGVLTAGTTGLVTVTVEERRPVSFVIPLLREATGIGSDPRDRS